jgi:hypothetical protein
MPATGYRLQDVWASGHEEVLLPQHDASFVARGGGGDGRGRGDVGGVTPSFSHTAEVPGGGGSRMFVLHPTPMATLERN